MGVISQGAWLPPGLRLGPPSALYEVEHEDKGRVITRRLFYDYSEAEEFVIQMASNPNADGVLMLKMIPATVTIDIDVWRESGMEDGIPDIRQGTRYAP